MKLLLHICCAPCSAYPIKYYKENNIDFTGYFCNPNIHPYEEYKKRLDALKEYSILVGFDVIYNDNYGLVEFTKNVINDINNRCSYCYYSRIEEVVKYAKENGYDAFTSTLFVSPYQKHELLKNICMDLSKKYDIEFLYKDFRPNYYDGQKIFKETGLYMQKYCGCIFSEYEPKLKNIEKSKELNSKLNKITERKIRFNNKYNGLNIREYNESDYNFIFNLKKNDEFDLKTNKKIVNNYISSDIIIIMIDNEPIGFYAKEIFLVDEFKNKGIENIILEELK